MNEQSEASEPTARNHFFARKHFFTVNELLAVLGELVADQPAAGELPLVFEGADGHEWWNGLVQTSFGPLRHVLLTRQPDLWSRPGEPLGPGDKVWLGEVGDEVVWGWVTEVRPMAPPDPATHKVQFSSRSWEQYRTQSPYIRPSQPPGGHWMRVESLVPLRERLK